MARSLLLLLLALSWYATVGAARAAPRGFVEAACAGTDYPALCVATLSPYAGAVGGSPARLAWAALTVSLGGARNASAALRGMTAGGGGMAPAAASAARDCVDMLGDAVDMLRRSVETMDGVRPGAGSMRFKIDSVRTWASAALTDDDMCMEGFRGAAAGGGGEREAVRAHILGVAHMTANALGIVNGLSKQSP